jgi:hypothetical protein
LSTTGFWRVAINGGGVLVHDMHAFFVCRVVNPAVCGFRTGGANLPATEHPGTEDMRKLEVRGLRDQLGSYEMSRLAS